MGLSLNPDVFKKLKGGAVVPFEGEAVEGEAVEALNPDDVPIDAELLDGEGDAVEVLATGEVDYSEDRTYIERDGVTFEDDGATSRPPIVPEWMRSVEGIRSTVWLAVCRWAYTVTWHVTRSHKYYGRLFGRAPVGLAVIVMGFGRWVADDRVNQSRAALAEGVTGNLVELEEAHTTKVRIRLSVAVLSVPFIALVAAVNVAAMPGSWQVALAASVPPLLGLAASGRKGSVVERVVYQGWALPPLKADLITFALTKLGIAELNKAYKDNPDHAISFLTPPLRLGRGYSAIIDLPAGVQVSDIVDKRGRFASGLRRPEVCVHVSALQGEQGHEGRLELFVADKPMRSGPPPVFELGRSPFNFFEPIPVGIDVRGRPVSITMMFAAMVVGAIPRMGKTFFVRLIALAAALDVRVKIHIFDFKGGVDFRAVGEMCAHTYRTGSGPDDVKVLKETLHRLKADMVQRYLTLNKLDEDICPEGKVTDELATARAYGLQPELLIIDETQVPLSDVPRADRDEINKALTDVSRRGPAVGIMVLLATQTVNNDTIPRAISTLAGLRACLKVADHTAGDLVLGTGAYGNGHQPSNLSLHDKGIAYLGGEGADIQLTRLAFVDGMAAREIATYARSLRQRANRLTGLAAGDDTDRDDDTDTVLDHVAAIWPHGANRPRLSYAELAALLADRWPSHYGGWETTQVSAALSPYGLAVVQCHVTNADLLPPGKTEANWRGVAIADIERAVWERANGGFDDEWGDGGPSTEPAPS